MGHFFHQQHPIINYQKHTVGALSTQALNGCSGLQTGQLFPRRNAVPISLAEMGSYNKILSIISGIWWLLFCTLCYVDKNTMSQYKYLIRCWSLLLHIMKLTITRYTPWSLLLHNIMKLTITRYTPWSLLLHIMKPTITRYTPLGWSKKYEFNESDLKCACDTIDRWLDDTAKGNKIANFLLL